MHNNISNTSAQLNEDNAQGSLNLVENEEIPRCAVANMRTGRKLVIAGFLISILGILLYCLPTVSSEITMGANSGLTVLGLGVLCWLVGAVKYLNAVIDSNDMEDVF